MSEAAFPPHWDALLPVFLPQEEASMSVLTALALSVVIVSILLAQGRPGHVLGFFCLVGLACVVAVSGVIGLFRPSRRALALARSR